VVKAHYSDSPDLCSLLAALRENESDHLLRLFACKCCRAVWPLFRYPGCHTAIESLEQFCAGIGGEEVLARVRQLADDVAWDAHASYNVISAVDYRASRVLFSAALADPFEAACFAAECAFACEKAWQQMADELQLAKELESPEKYAEFLRLNQGKFPAHPVTFSLHCLTMCLREVAEGAGG
jgi:hypothetical protein